jgi:hypothetical protein
MSVAEQVMTTEAFVGEYLEHYGVKGMKWGVRKRYLEKRDKIASRQERVASGNASLRDKAKVALTTSNVDLVKGKGLKGAAALRAERERAHMDRVNNGRENAMDVLKRHGLTSIADIVAGGRDKYRKKS